MGPFHAARRPEPSPKGDSGARTIVGILLLVAVMAIPGLARSLFAGVAGGNASASELVAVTGIMILAASAVIMVMAPFFMRRIRTALTTDAQAWSTDVLLAAEDPQWAKAVLTVLTDHPIEARALVEHLFSDTLNQREADRERLRQMETRMEHADRTITALAEGVRILPELQRTMERVTDALTDLKAVVRQVAEENAAQGREVSHMRGIMDAAYEGPERRHSGRRRDDHG